MRWFRIAISFMAVAVRAAPASDCACLLSGPPCQAFFKADAIFVGTVRNIRDVKPDNPPFEKRLVQFSIEDAVRGVQGANIDIVTDRRAGGCSDVDFEAGLRYVVYAQRLAEGTFTTSTCSRTGLASEADDDLQYFATRAAVGSGASVFGTIYHTKTDARGHSVDRDPIAGVQVVVRGERGVFDAITDEAGRYRISGVPPGRYEFEPLPPAEYSRRYPQHKIELRDSRSCLVENVALEFDGRISGIVLNADGRPAANVRVEVVWPSRIGDPSLAYGPSQPTATTDVNGRFEIIEVPPGQYILGVGLTRPSRAPTVAYPRTFHPGTTEAGEAVPISLEPGGRVALEPLLLPPPLPSYELTGVVVTSDGIPQPRAGVQLRDPRGVETSESVLTDVDGRFTLRVFADLAYAVNAWSPGGGASSSELVSATLLIGTIKGPPEPVRLVLTSTR